MEDKIAHKLIREMRDRLLADIPAMEKQLAEHNAWWDEDPEPLLEKIISRDAEKLTRMRLDAEALAIAASKF